MRYALLIYTSETMDAQATKEEMDALMAAYNAFGAQFHHHYHAARADLLRRAGRRAAAATAYQRALAHCHNQVERRYLIRRLGELA